MPDAFEILINSLKIKEDSTCQNTDRGREEVYWHQSIWSHKLLSVLYWTQTVKGKLLGNDDNRVVRIPADLSAFSIRPSIMFRWIEARGKMRSLVNSLGKVSFYVFAGKKVGYIRSGSDIDSVRKNIEAESGKIIIASKETDKFIEKSANGNIDDDWIEAYEISRYLYFSLQNIRLISRKNVDLVFPSVSQIYYVQWKLLAQILFQKITNKNRNKENLFDNYLLNIKNVFRHVDGELSKYERIPPTHFDYQHIYSRTLSLLMESRNIYDPTSRSRSSILQPKYYLHDDHADPEFKMDWTLAHMFTLTSHNLYDEVVETDKWIRKFFKNIK